MQVSREGTDVSRHDVDDWAKQFGVPDRNATRGEATIASCEECQHRVAHLVPGGEYDDDHWRFSCSIGARNKHGKCEHFAPSLIGPETPMTMVMVVAALAMFGMIVAAIISQ